MGLEPGSPELHPVHSDICCVTLHKIHRDSVFSIYKMGTPLWSEQCLVHTKYQQTLLLLHWLPCCPPTEPSGQGLHTFRHFPVGGPSHPPCSFLPCALKIEGSLTLNTAVTEIFEATASGPTCTQTRGAHPAGLEEWSFPVTPSLTFSGAGVLSSLPPSS